MAIHWIFSATLNLNAILYNRQNLSLGFEKKRMTSPRHHGAAHEDRWHRLEKDKSASLISFIGWMDGAVHAQWAGESGLLGE